MAGSMETQGYRGRTSFSNHRQSLDRFGALFCHQLRCSAAPNGGHPVCTFLFQVGVIRMNPKKGAFHTVV